MSLIPGIVMSFREGLEALLIIVLILQYLSRTNNTRFNKSCVYGLFTGVIFSILVVYSLNYLRFQISELDKINKIWESLFSLAAVLLIVSFIVSMINYGSSINEAIINKIELNLSKSGLFLVSLFLIAREGVEIGLFFFVGSYNYVSILIGLLLSTLASFFVYLTFLKIDLKKVFNLTTIYLIIQAGYLFGYSIHEALPSIISYLDLNESSFYLTKVFDLSTTVFNHKEGVIGLPMNIIFGWYSKPELIQIVFQYLLTISLILLFYSKQKIPVTLTVLKK